MIYPLTHVSVLRQCSTFIRCNLQMTCSLPLFHISCVIAETSFGLVRELTLLFVFSWFWLLGVPEALTFIPGSSRTEAHHATAKSSKERQKYFLTPFFVDVYNRLCFSIGPSTVILLHFSTKCKWFEKSFKMVGAGGFLSILNADFHPRLE